MFGTVCLILSVLPVCRLLNVLGTVGFSKFLNATVIGYLRAAVSASNN